MIADLYFVCDAYGCVRGLVKTGGNDWPVPCPVCKGRGSISLAKLCKRIGEHESTVRRILQRRARSRSKVAARICGKVVDLLATYSKTKTKQTEMFA